MGLDNWFARQRMGMDPLLGHPIVDDGMDLGGPGSFAMRVAFQRFLQNQQARRERRRIGDDEDLGADEEEADELGADLADDEDIDELGAASPNESLEGLDERITKLKEKRQKKVKRLNKARSKPRRRVLMNQIEKIDDNLKQLRAQQKETEAMTRGGGRGRGRGRDNGDGPGALRAGRANTDVQGRWDGMPAAGREVSVAALAGGDTMANGNFPMGTAAGSQVAFSFQTAQITFATFRVLGVKITGWLRAYNPRSATTVNAPYGVQAVPSDCCANIVVDTVQANGYPNVIYADNIMSLGGQFGSASSKVIEGIRDNSLVRRNNTVTVAGYITNPFLLFDGVTIASSAMEISLSAEVLLDVIEDDVFAPGGGD